ncbi:efflux RND transporter permease subunit [Glaciecola sp. MH2013]|uniref:efflux RND transporter permease subunit n=1 Tax=Glaciecola sp. MH2013 TaxID=2785524 RepID=UPI00189C6BD2|nr:efflux RND transporter permease subunit [Glaciecola sp. MH2013]MBF7072054.1 efflux RND transporter permease subunit [Glaciecola sp. MH2013]
MNLSNIGLKYNRVLMTAVISLMIFGVVSYFTLPAQEDPSIKIREAVITTNFPGMSAEKIELLVTKTVEEAVRNVDEVEEIRSISTQGTSVVYVDLYDRYFDLDQIWDKVRNELDKVQNQLPDGTQAHIINDNFGDVAILTVALQADKGISMGDMFDMAQHARDMMYTVEGTQSVDILGAQQENIVIEISDVKAAQLGLSPDQLISTLQQQNVLRSGGTVNLDGKSFSIIPSGDFRDIQSIREVIFTLPNVNTTIHLGDLARVYRSTQEPAFQTAYFNGERAIVLAIAKNNRFSVTEYSPRLEAMIAQLEQQMPAGISLNVITRQADQVNAAVDGVSISVIQTLAIVLGVVILFLGFRIGIIVGAIVPAVVLIVLAILNFTGMALERMSLATLIISLGLLVDNGIVVAEDFKKRLENGEKRRDIVSSIGKTLAIPLLTSSATTMLVFLPLMLAESDSGEYTRSVSIVIIYSLFTSWILSLMVTPFLCYLFIKDGEKKKESGIHQKVANFFDLINPLYEVILHFVLRFRLFTLALAILLFIGAGAAMSIVPVKFFPDSDRAQVLAYIDLPAGASMRETEAVLEDVFVKLNDKKRYPHVENYAAYGGFGGPRFVLSLTPITPEAGKSFIMLNLTDRRYQDDTIANLREDFLTHFPQVNARVTKMFLGPSDSNKIDVQVIGPDKEYIYETALEIQEIFRKLEGTVEIKNDWENKVTQLDIQIDQARAKRAGLTSADIARSLETFFSGIVVSEFREGDDLIPIIIRGAPEDRFDISRIYDVNIYSPQGQTNIPLEQVATIAFTPQYARIARENLFRTVTVEAKNLYMTAEDMVPILEPEFDKLRETLPPAHRIEFDGVVKDSRESQASLNANLPLCLAVIMLILIAQFNSLRRAGIVIMTVPLILIGAVVGLLAVQANFGFMVILGLYALAGIIVNNAIVLIDRIDIERKENDDQYQALVHACMRRLRPIVMSTVTTILGLLPLIIGQDALFFGMATALAFGLAIGTLLTLGVVPVLYSLLFRLPGRCN